MNEVLKAMKERRSVRAFKPDLPPKELLEQIAEAGIYAPSGRNSQSAIILAVTDPITRKKLMEANRAIQPRHIGAGGRRPLLRRSCHLRGAPQQRGRHFDLRR